LKEIHGRLFVQTFPNFVEPIISVYFFKTGCHWTRCWKGSYLHGLCNMF